MTDIIFILMAGGESKRFCSSILNNNLRKIPGEQLAKNQQYDKLLSQIPNSERTLLEQVVRELLPIGNILIVTRGQEREKIYSKILSNINQTQNKFIITTEKNHRSYGPLGGMSHGLSLPQVKNHDIKIILPSDLPHIECSTIERFISKIRHILDYDIIGIIHPNGQVEHLIMAFRDLSILYKINFLLKKGIYRTSSLFRIIPNKCFINSIELRYRNRSVKTFRDYDMISQNYDFKPNINMRKQQRIGSPIIIFNRREMSQDPSDYYRKFLEFKSMRSGQNGLVIEKIEKLLLKEAEIYLNKKVLSIGLHCLIDAYKITENKVIHEKISILKKKII
ncbi:MAG: NTP transferase domain-containing protein [Candidatus Hodarchaeales archaeon]